MPKNLRKIKKWRIFGVTTSSKERNKRNIGVIMDHAERLKEAFAQAAQKNRPGAIVYVYRPRGNTGKSRQGAYSPFGVKHNGDLKLRIANGNPKTRANLAVLGFFPAKPPVPSPAGVKKAPVKTEKAKPDEQAEI